MSATSSMGSKYTMRPSRAGWPGSSTIGAVTPATTCAFVTTRSGARTNPDPVALVPHAYATPETRATDAAATASSGSSSATGGAVGCTSRSRSTPSCGRPSSRTADRTRARVSATGRGVTASMARSTCDDASAVEMPGVPVAATLDEIRLSESAPASTASAPPSTRSTTRNGVLRSTPRRNSAPIAPPAAAPPSIRATARAITTITREFCHGHTSFTIGTSQNAAKPPSTSPISAPRLASSPRCTPIEERHEQDGDEDDVDDEHVPLRPVVKCRGVQRTHRFLCPRSEKRRLEKRFALRVTVTLRS